MILMDLTIQKSSEQSSCLQHYYNRLVLFSVETELDIEGNYI